MLQILTVFINNHYFSGLYRSIALNTLKKIIERITDFPWSLVLLYLLFRHRAIRPTITTVQSVIKTFFSLTDNFTFNPTESTRGLPVNRKSTSVSIRLEPEVRCKHGKYSTVFIDRSIEVGFHRHEMVHTSTYQHYT